MQANIPINLNEALLASELGELIEIAEKEERPVEWVMIKALREYMAARRTPLVQQELMLPES